MCPSKQQLSVHPGIKNKFTQKTVSDIKFFKQVFHALLTRVV